MLPSSQEMTVNHPMLKEQDIVTYLCSIGLVKPGTNPMSKQTPETITELYLNLALLMFQKSKEDINKIPYSMMTAYTTNTVKFADGFEFQSAFQLIKKMMTTLNVPGFSLMDIYKPTYKRIKAVLSIIVSYLQFRQQQYQIIKPDKDALVEARNYEEKCKAEVAKLEAEHEKLREKIKDAQPILEQMNETKRQKLQEKEHLLIQKEREEQCRVERSRELESLEKEIKDAERVAAESRENVERLKQMLVSSPQRVIKQHHQLTEDIAKEKAKIQELEQALMFQDYKQEEISTLHSLLEYPCNYLKDLIQFQEEKKGKSVLVKDKLRKIENTGLLLDQEKREMEANLKVIASIEERLEAINKSQKSIKEQKTGLLKTMQDQRDDHQKDIDEVTAKTGEIMELEAQLDKEIENAKSFQETCMQRALKMYDGMTEAIDSYHENLLLLVADLHNRVDQSV